MKAVAALLFALCSFQAFACSCEEITPENVRESLRQADAVFLGTPTTDSRTIRRDEYSETVTTTFRVHKSFKNAPRRIRLRSERSDGANCGVDFKRGEGKFIVFAYRDEGRLTTDGCSVVWPGERGDNADLIRTLERASN